MSSTRRNFFQNAAALSAAIFGLSDQVKAQVPPPSTRVHHVHAEDASPGPLVITPDVPDLPYELDGATKVFRLTAEVVKRKLAPFKTIDAWGYNGSCPGPTIQINQNDRVRVIFENNLPESTTVHWHGLEIPIEQDGVPWISQKPIPPGEKYTYEFTVHQEGTFFYHAHSAMQEMQGQIGLFIAHPATPYRPEVDHDYAIVLAGVGRPPEQHRPQQRRHGVQLAHLQRRLRPRDHADDRAPRQPRSPAPRKSRYGSSPDPSARPPVRANRHRRRPRSRIDLVSDEHRALSASRKLASSSSTRNIPARGWSTATSPIT